MSEFQREDRYIVIKRSDLERLRGGQTEGLRQQLSKVYPLLPRRQCAVIESDWPEFEQVWRMIEARVAGNPLPDYDALAAQRDEGLARERMHEQHIKALEACVQLADKQRDHWMDKTKTLQQRLAEAGELLRETLAMYDDGIGRDDEDGAPYEWKFWEKIHIFLARPGCADGEKPE